MSDFNNDSNNNFKDFLVNHTGGILGGLIALVLCFTGLHKVLIDVAIIVAGALIGDYVQKNKINVKEKLKSFIDKF